MKYFVEIQVFPDARGPVERYEGEEYRRTSFHVREVEADSRSQAIRKAGMSIVQDLRAIENGTAVEPPPPPEPQYIHPSQLVQLERIAAKIDGPGYNLQIMKEELEAIQLEKSGRGKKKNANRTTKRRSAPGVLG